jgi:hypothetical protein
MSARCEGLGHLSSSNRALRKIVRALAALEAAKTAGAAIPGGGLAVLALGQATAASARAAAQAIARYQDWLLIADRLAAASALRCGPPASIPGPAWIERKPTPQAALAGAPPPLEWGNSPADTFIEVASWDLEARSFAYCGPKGAARLDGETYAVIFRAPREAAGKPPSSAWFSW